MKAEFILKDASGYIPAFTQEMSAVPRAEEVIEIHGRQFIVTEVVWVLAREGGIDVQVRGVG